MPGTHDAVPIRPPEPGHVTRGHIVRVQQHLMLGPPAEDRIPGVARIVENRPDRAALPPISEPMPVLLRPSGRRARYVVLVEPVGNRAVPHAVEVLSEDPADHLGRRLINRQYPKPVALGCLAWVGVRRAVDHDVSVRCPAALVPSL